MLDRIKKDNKGFTIIEVLIVLAIAGLIILIVFLAVPALQRNSRNTQRRNDVAAMLGAISDFATNNNGKLPDDITLTDGVFKAELSTCASCDATEGKVAYYTGQGTGIGEVEIQPAGVYGPYETPADDRVTLVIGAACDTSGNGASTTGAARSYVAVFSTEVGSNSFSGQCEES